MTMSRFRASGFHYLRSANGSTIDASMVEPQTQRHGKTIATTTTTTTNLRDNENKTRVWARLNRRQPELETGEWIRGIYGKTNATEVEIRRPGVQSTNAAA